MRLIKAGGALTPLPRWVFAAPPATPLARHRADARCRALRDTLPWSTRSWLRVFAAPHATPRARRRAARAAERYVPSLAGTQMEYPLHARPQLARARARRRLLERLHE